MTDASSVSLGRETAKGAIAKFTMALTGFIGAIVFARLLGPRDFGGYFLLFAIVKLADRPTSGIAAAAKKRFSESTSSGSEVFGALLVAIVLWVVPISVGAFLASEYLVSYTGLRAAPLLFISLLTAEAAFEPCERLLQAQGRVGLASWIDTVRSYLTFPFQLVFVLAGMGAAGMAYGLVVATGLVVPVALWYLSITPKNPSRQTLEGMWSFAKYSIPTAVVGKAYGSFDLLLLGALIGPVASGHYEVASKLSVPATFIGISAASGLMARVSNLKSKGKEFAEDITNTLSFASILAIPIFVGVFALPEVLIVTVFGAEYRPAASLLVGLTFYRVIRSQTIPLMRAIDGIDRPQINRNISILTLGINIVLGVYLVILWGAVGVVVATVVAESVRYLIVGRKLRQIVPGVNLLTKAVAKQAIAAAVMFIVVTLFAQLLSIRTWAQVVAVVGLGGATYFVVLTAISEELRTTIGGMISESWVEEYVPYSVRQR